MRFLKYSAIIALLLLCCTVAAKDVTKTLYSSSGDKITVIYRITQDKGMVTIEFLNVEKNLADHGRNYKNSDKIVALFFDRKGGYGSDVSFSGNINTNAFSVPSGLKYTPSNDGFFVLDNWPAPKLQFESNTSEKVNLSIPIYLAKHPKRGNYELFQDCGRLEIAINPVSTQTSGGRSGQTTEIIEYDEIEGSNNEEIAWSLIADIETALKFEESSSLSSELTNKVSQLNALKPKINDKRLIKEIDRITQECLEKQNELKNQALKLEQARAQEEAKAQEENTEKQLYINCTDTINCRRYLEIYGDTGIYSAQVKEKLDDLRKEKKDTDDKQRKRNIWMILGGGLLAALLFVGNHVMRTISNNKTQRSIMEMQQDLTKKATRRVERTATSAIQNKTHQVTNAARNKQRELINKGNPKTHPFKSKKKPENKTENKKGKTENNKGNNQGNNKGNNKPISI